VSTFDDEDFMTKKMVVFGESWALTVADKCTVLFQSSHTSRK
jgi:hypothetical protein